MFIAADTGEKVRYIRKSNDLNQKEFAVRIGISQGTLSDIERSVCLPSYETIIALKGRFSCDLNWLLMNDAINSTSNQASLTDDELQLIDSIRFLPMREKRELVEIIHIKIKKNKYPYID